MKKLTTYQAAKNDLLGVAKAAKTNFKTDKPKIRMIINDYCDYLCKNRDLTSSKINLLHDYAASLHP